MPINCDLSRYVETANDVYVPLLNCRDRYLLLFGGSGSGKSEEIARRILMRILAGMSKQIKHKVLALRKTQPAVRKSVFSLFGKYIDLWNLRGICQTNRKEMTYRFDGGPMIMCGGLDDVEKVKSIEGLTLVWLEELTEFKVEDFREIDRRLRGEVGTFLQIVMSFNPVEVKWIIDEFFEFDDKMIDGVGVLDITDPERDGRVHRFKKMYEVNGKIIEVCGSSLMTTYKDNRFVDEKYQAVLENLKRKDIVAYRIYALGQWGSPKGLIYEEGVNWKVISRWPKRSDFEKYGYGLDWGYSNSPTGLIELGIIGNEIWERERIYKTKLTNQDIARELVKLGINKSHLICADCAEPKSIDEVKEAGFKIIGCRKGADSIRNGISLVKDYFVNVYGDSENLIKEKRNYKWAENKEGETINEPVDAWNHLMDPERYIVDELCSHRVSTFAFNLGKRYA